jgi:hypothetical protein
MFLHSDAEYEWPSDAPDFSGDFLLLVLCALLISAAFILTPLIKFPLLSLTGLACAALSACVYTYSQRRGKQAYEDFVARRNRGGDFDVWPFLKTVHFDFAKSAPRLLVGVAVG